MTQPIIFPPTSPDPFINSSIVDLAFNTLADMTAAVGYGINSKGTVYNDPTAANNGVYRKATQAGAAGWVYLGPITDIVNTNPYYFSTQTNAAASTIQNFVQSIQLGGILAPGDAPTARWNSANLTVYNATHASLRFTSNAGTSYWVYAEEWADPRSVGITAATADANSALQALITQCKVLDLRFAFYAVNSLFINPTDACNWVFGTKNAGGLKLNAAATNTSALLNVQKDYVTVSGITSQGEYLLTYNASSAAWPRPGTHIRVATAVTGAGIVTGVKVEDCRCLGGRNAISAWSVQDYIAARNFSDRPYEYGITTGYGGRNVRIMDNDCIGSFLYEGIKSGSDNNVLGIGHEDLRIHGNKVRGTGRGNLAGLEQEGIDSYIPFARRVRIYDNVIFGCGHGGLECKTSVALSAGGQFDPTYALPIGTTPLANIVDDVYSDVCIYNNDVTITTDNDGYGIAINYISDYAGAVNAKIRRFRTSGNTVRCEIRNGAGVIILTPAVSAAGILVNICDEYISANDQFDRCNSGHYLSAAFYASGTGATSGTLARVMIHAPVARNCTYGLNAALIILQLDIYSPMYRVTQKGIITANGSTVTGMRVHEPDIQDYDPAAGTATGIEISGAGDCEVYGGLISTGSYCLYNHLDTSTIKVFDGVYKCRTTNTSRSDGAANGGIQMLGSKVFPGGGGSSHLPFGAGLAYIVSNRGFWDTAINASPNVGGYPGEFYAARAPTGAVRGWNYTAVAPNVAAAASWTATA